MKVLEIKYWILVINKYNFFTTHLIDLNKHNDTVDLYENFNVIKISLT